MYVDRKGDQRVYFVCCWMEQIHHILIPILSYWTLYVSCGNEEGWPWLSEKGGSYTSLHSDKRWGYFKDDVCMMEVNKGYPIVLAIANGYLTFSYFVINNWIKEKTKLNEQTQLHHVVAITGFVGCCISGYSFPGNAAFTISCEASSIFLNYKDMFSKESRMTLLG